MDYIGFIIAIIAICAAAGFLAVLLYRTAKEKGALDKKLMEKDDELTKVLKEVTDAKEELSNKYREIKENEASIKKLAYEDKLTGLPNKAAFDELLGHTLETLRKGESCAVMYIDLDDFKTFDDTWGHGNCDELILDISHRLRQNLDENDYIARMNGDEFIILTQNIEDSAEFDNKLKRIEKAFHFPFLTSFGQMMVTVSIGIAMAPKDGKKADIVLRNASYALAEAKIIGKDTYCYFSEDIEKKELDEIDLKSDLANAIQNDDFLLRYEPVINIRDKSIDSLRLKLIWDRGEKGIWRAARFSRFAEKTGQINQLGMNAFRRVCEEMKRFPDKKMIFPLTKRIFMSVDFETSINTIINETGVDRSKIIFELSEEVIGENFDDCLFFVKSLTDKGFQFRIGSFGNGLCSMRILRDFPVNEVAVSVMGIYAEHEDEDSAEFVSLVTENIRKFNKVPVFTDISDPVYENIVIKNGGNLVEGELYGGIMTAEQVENLKASDYLSA